MAIGDAIVDVIATCEDSFIAERGLTKGSMRLLSTVEADELYAAMVVDRESGRALVFGGRDADRALGDLWALTGMVGGE